FILKLAIRSIIRKKGFTIINLTGLAIGLAATLYIATFLFQEYNYDKSYADSGNIYRGILEYRFGENVKKAAYCVAPAGPDIAERVPEIEQFTRISSLTTETVKLDETFYTIENICAADDHFFEFLGHELLIGNPKNVLTEPGQIVLSESEAKKLYSNINPIGQSFQRENGQVLTVSGIFMDFPANSSLKTNAVYSYKTIEQDKSVYLGWNGGESFLTLFRLIPGVTAESVLPKIQEVLDLKINKRFKKDGWGMFISLQKMTDAHLTTNLDFDLSSNRDKGFLLIISLIGLIILLLAVVNYLNLTSALAGERGKQVGIQKLSGAIRGKIVSQGFVEALLTTFFASLMSLVILAVDSPYLDLLLNTTVIFNPLQTGLILMILVICTGLLSGIYPSLVLARKNILSSFKQNDFKGRKQPLRNVLVIFQFGIAVIFIIALLTVNRQLTYLLNENMGFNTSNVLQLMLRNNYEDINLSVLQNQIEMLPEIEETSYSSHAIGDEVAVNGFSVEGSEEAQLLSTLYADADFLDFYNIEITDGRNFYDSPESDKTTILVNESFVSQQSWDSWQGKGVSRNGKKEIIGVVKDFNFKPLTSSIQPLIIIKNPKPDRANFNCLNIRLSTNDIESSIKKIESIWSDFETSAHLDIHFLEDRLDKSYSDIATYRKIVLLFSLIAVFIACIGLLGLTAFMNRLRIKEIGIRKVNGASLAELLVMLLKDFSRCVIISLILAIPVSWYLLNQWLENFAYKTTLSWWIFALAGVLAFGIALLTVIWQSWRTATRNPVEALRYE
ncbi:MAG TPA: FtsX-like permease family protein, partial [Draconibacterium sp.]|nr:FtsX-like permease family protein [Draconibacterium sp.]